MSHTAISSTIHLLQHTIINRIPKLHSQATGFFKTVQLNTNIFTFSL